MSQLVASIVVEDPTTEFKCQRATSELGIQSHLEEEFLSSLTTCDLAILDFSMPSNTMKLIDVRERFGTQFPVVFLVEDYYREKIAVSLRYDYILFYPFDEIDLQEAIKRVQSRLRDPSAKADPISVLSTWIKDPLTQLRQVNRVLNRVQEHLDFDAIRSTNS